MKNVINYAIPVKVIDNRLQVFCLKHDCMYHTIILSSKVELSWMSKNLRIHSAFNANCKGCISFNIILRTTLAHSRK